MIAFYKTITVWDVQSVTDTTISCCYAGDDKELHFEMKKPKVSVSAHKVIPWKRVHGSTELAIMWQSLCVLDLHFPEGRTVGVCAGTSG